jgi:hypothetical protein
MGWNVIDGLWHSKFFDRPTFKRISEESGVVNLFGSQVKKNKMHNG